MTDNTKKLHYNKSKIVLMLVGLVVVLSIATYFWPFLNKPNLAIRKGMIIIFWLFATHSGTIMIYSLFSTRPAITIDSEGFYVSRLLGGIGWINWSNINRLILRNSKIKVVLIDRKSVKNKFILIDRLFLNIWQNSIYISKTFLLDISMPELHREMEINYHQYCSKDGSIEKHTDGKCLEISSDKNNLGNGQIIVYGYSTLGLDFSPLLIAGKKMFKYQDRFYRFDDIKRIDQKGTNLLNSPQCLPSAKIIMKDGTEIKIVENLVRKDRPNEFDVLSEGTDAFYELLNYFGSEQ